MIALPFLSPTSRFSGFGGGDGRPSSCIAATVSPTIDCPPLSRKRQERELGYTGRRVQVGKCCRCGGVRASPAPVRSGASPPREARLLCQPRIILLRTSRYTGQQHSHTSMKPAEKSTPAIVSAVARSRLWDVVMVSPPGNYLATNVNIW